MVTEESTALQIVLAAWLDFRAARPINREMVDYMKDVFFALLFIIVVSAEDSAYWLGAARSTYAEYVSDAVPAASASPLSDDQQATGIEDRSEMPRPGSLLWHVRAFARAQRAALEEAEPVETDASGQPIYPWSASSAADGDPFGDLPTPRGPAPPGYMDPEERAPHGFDGVAVHAEFLRRTRPHERRTLRSESDPRPGSRAASREGTPRRSPPRHASSAAPPDSDSAPAAEHGGAAAPCRKSGPTDLEAD